MDVIWWWLLLLATFMVSLECAGTGWACASTTLIGLSSCLVAKTTAPFNYRRVTITSFWYLTYLAMIFFPAFFVFAEQEGPYRAGFLFAVESVLITVPLGWCLASRYFHCGKEETELYFSRPTIDLASASSVSRKFLFLFLIAIALTCLYLLEVRTVPLFHLFSNSGDYWQLLTLREESFKLLDSPLRYLYSLMRSLLYPFLVIVSFGWYLRSRQGKWLILFILSFTSALFYASLTLAKAPVAVLFLLLILFGYLYRGGALSRKVIAVGLIAVLLFPVLVIVYAAPAEDVVDAHYVFLGIAGRLLHLPAEVVYYYFEIFPSHVPYLHGRSIDKFARLTGQSYFDTPNYVGRYAYPLAQESISANGAFIADLNADFGMSGVLLGGILTGFIMQWFHIWTVRRKKTITTIALYSFLVVTFWFLNSTSLPILLASNGAVLALILSWWLDNPASLALQQRSHKGSKLTQSIQTT